jgi:hypothetical protein
VTTCTDPHERKYRCFYCGNATAQAPVLVTWHKDAPSERLYPSCCADCATKSLWLDLGAEDAPPEIVEEARKFEPCPLAQSLDHACSTRAAMVQWAYDRISAMRGIVREGSS